MAVVENPFRKLQIDGLVQDCSNSIVNALRIAELLQSCTKQSK